MKSQFLTTDNFLRGKMFSLLERLHPMRIASIKTNFGKGKWIKKQNKENLTSVGIFRQHTKKVIVKHVSCRFKNLIVRQLLNEASMLTLFGKLTSSIQRKVAFPRVFEYVANNNEAYLVSEYVQGKLLSTASNKKKIEVLTEIQLALREMTENIDTKTRSKLPKRNFSIILPLFWFYLLKLFVRNASIPQATTLIRLFLENILLSLFSKRDLVLSHKDLHDANIILGKKIFVIDPEVSVLADPMTDMAHIARYYAKSMTADEIETLLEKLDVTKIGRMRFLALTIFYSIQMMAIREENDPDYVEAYEYLKNYLPSIVKETRISFTFGELIYYKVLGLLSMVPLNKQSKPFVLCYHSISSDSWRFSTSKKEFEKQMKYLARNKKVVNLETLMKKREKNMVAVTFDDGYQDFKTVALPILKKYKIPSTLFVMSGKANREALSNNKQTLSLEEIQQLETQGVVVGFHSSSHSDLSKLNRVELVREIKEGKRKLEKKLGHALAYFAYPMGISTKEVEELALQSGFAYAFTTDGGSVLNSSNYHIGRVCVEGGLNAVQFETLVSKVGLTFNAIFNTLLQLKAQIVGQFIRQFYIVKRDINLLLASPKNYLYTYTTSPYAIVEPERYYPQAYIKAQSIKRKLKNALPKSKVHHIGSSRLKIVGHKDIDFLVESTDRRFETDKTKLTQLFGYPACYGKSVEWVFEDGGFNVEISLMKTGNPTISSIITVTDALRNNARLLKKYVEFKRSFAGRSLRQYDRNRMAFFNTIERGDLNLSNFKIII